MCLICDTISQVVARNVVDPMMQLPRLAACSIRLSNRYDAALHALAENTVNSLTDRQDQQPRLIRPRELPNELQLRVLQFTELVAPYDLDWSATFGFVCRSASSSSGSRKLNPCEICAGVRSYCRSELVGVNFEKLGRPIGSYAFKCHCWRYPRSLLLVSRQFAHEATRIFYSMNHFKIHYCDKALYWLRPNVPSPRCIEKLSLLALQNLRSLQLNLSEAIDNSVWPRQHESLLEAISLLARFADFSRLTVFVVFNDDDLYIPTRTAVTLRGLRGVKELFVYLPRCWGETQAQMSRRLDREKIVERGVMGGKYNSPSEIKYANTERWKLFVEN